MKSKRLWKSGKNIELAIYAVRFAVAAHHQASILNTKVCSGGTPSSKHSEYYDGDIPWLNTKEINFNRIYGTEKRITEEGLKKSSAKWIKENSVIVAMYGATAGKAAIAKIPLTTNQACCNLTINPSVADYRFVYYFLCYKFVELASLANGGAQQNLNAQIIKDFEIPLPSLPEQEQIGNILSSLDDKIEVNRKINENLEQQAQALFKSWFVDFEPFKNGEFVESELGMIPKGWRVGKLGEICNVFTGKKDVKQSQPIGLYPFFSCSPNHTYSNEYIYDGPSIIIAGNGSYTGRTSFYFGKFDLYQRTYACTIKEGFNEKIISFLYYMMKCLFEPVKMGGTRGSSIPYIVMNDIVLQKFALENSLVEKYSDFAYNIMKQIQQNNQESRRLAELRDILLPKLMSGELKVNEIEDVL